MKVNLIVESVSKVWPAENVPLFPETARSFSMSVLGFVIDINLVSDITLILVFMSTFGLIQFYWLLI